ncbi:hypothetical protein N7462_009759 [Penicillium macrosclerotiorum]|uniref:uncharacterized protein n=1 Tax=Penicillium macrosclerotiorum TaxID=303699 RepID=UPI00254859C9|nr:uncharacterized protein N7462_009759 [Penicillium macrosclerotiorum]KAJ5668689.1 hypothetical protein N7462_009759 [Penicillium macrosclerotiorum]
MDLSSLAKLQTEGVNPHTVHIDRMSTLEMCTVINSEDHRVAESVEPCLTVIAGAIDALALRVRRGGRVVYVGAGTSGRLGILDASEIPPTFAASRDQFIGLIAGGDAAIRQAQEGAEDNAQEGEIDMKNLQLNPELDSIIGIASSGRTPYVLGCLAFAKQLGCLTIGVVCVSPSALSQSGNADYLIAPLPGPEVVTGSTRLKSGTATKLVLNMLSTGTMIRTGKTYGNMMVDLVASNLKLKQRSRNILRRLSTECAAMSDSGLDALLSQCQHSVKLAILVAETGHSVDNCKQHLVSAGGVLSNALEGASQPVALEHTPSRKFTLCIDGGGTKCAAVVTDGANIASHGYSGPCNLTDGIGNMDGVMATLVEATKSALKAHLPDPLSKLTQAEWKHHLRSCFNSAWIGLAGLDRAGVKDALAPKLAEIFGLDPATKSFCLTNDVDLLPASIPVDKSIPPVSTLVLIAGTGSISMRYSWTEDLGYHRVARSGGWGHILGDEGGGYSIGLAAIKQTLAVLEEQTLGLRPGLGQFEHAVVKKLGCEKANDGNINLLNDLLAPHEPQIAKARIAGVAEVVLNLVPSDQTAQDIVTKQIEYLVSKTLGRLLDSRSTGYTVPEQTQLVLAGGLIKNQGYQDLLKSQLSQQGLGFRGIHVVGDSGGQI